MSEHPQWQPTNPPTPPVQQQSWFARNKVLSIVLGISLVFLLCCCGGGMLAMSSDLDTDSTSSASDESAETAADTESEEADTSSAADDASETSETTKEPSSSSSSSEPEKEEPTKDKKEKKPAKKEKPGVGTPVRDGKFEFTVTKVETGVSSIGESFMAEEPDGQFVLVHITVKNIGDESQTLFDSEQTLKDGQGRSFDTDSAALFAMDDNIWMEDINPGNSMKGTLVYDMPSDAEPAEIELHDSMFSGGVTVSLK